MRALKNLGLDVSKGTVSTEGPVKQTKFFITQADTGRKVEDPDMLERIRLTIINNLLKYHPESSELLAMGEVFGIKAPQKKSFLSSVLILQFCYAGYILDFYTRRFLVHYNAFMVPMVTLSPVNILIYCCFSQLNADIATHIHVKQDGPKRSLLYIETADRPGLLVEIIKVIADVNIDVESAEIDTEGLIAKDKFHVSYGGAALNSSMSQVLVNCLRYYLRTPETDIDSY
ncbi:hypothetical protein Ahy_A09g041958 isoform D [Arachis hypogaea]|uniref:ACT domain-containing protein ACR n=1 Tax=Arachis hypogaea TaxID=3818 RepID=A0A445BEC1_ARAHY|nr:hypothetical protein Ahy_A09g041958 isoform D [Arachis hypogaea]